MSEIDMNPGGRLAKKKGCLCPELDNGHGHRRGDRTFWIDCVCPLHGKRVTTQPVKKPHTPTEDKEEQ